MENREMRLVTRSHKTGDVPCRTVPDFCPLTKRDIYLLLKKAKQTGNNELRNGIQGRLNQGIKGQVSPRTAEGEVAEKTNAVDELYNQNYTKGPTNELVNQFYELMN
jgi:hypothetical protein